MDPLMTLYQMYLQINPPIMEGKNQGMIGIPGLMEMNNNNMSIDMMRNNLRMMGYNELIIDEVIKIYNQKKQKNQKIKQNNNNSGCINLIFRERNYFEYINIVVKNNESIISVINKYIKKSGNKNNNIYISNGQQLDEEKTVEESELSDNTIIDVINLENLDGA